LWDAIHISRFNNRDNTRLSRLADFSPFFTASLTVETAIFTGTGYSSIANTVYSHFHRHRAFCRREGMGNPAAGCAGPADRLPGRSDGNLRLDKMALS
jgi:hypothetical protein